MDDVQIVEAPVSTYVTRTSTATLMCRAFNAKEVRFKCNDVWLENKRHKDTFGTDDLTSLQYLKTEVIITLDEVEKVVKKRGKKDDEKRDFLCKCYATGEVNQIISDVVRVDIAYLKKSFIEFPLSQIVLEGTTVELRCAPPEANPKAEVSWLKNGVKIERSEDANLIFANDNSLIISSIRLKDRGNYNCEASNFAASRTSDTATLEVYVDGQWAEWTEWSSSCENIDCPLLRKEFELRKGDRKTIEQFWPRQIRHRTCNNPAPMNGGAPCKGIDEDVKPCTFNCPVDGQWSSWTDWSACTTSCHEVRTRQCDSPPVTNRGQNCTGRSRETRPCLPGSGSCRNTVHPSPFETSPLETQLAMYAGLGSVVILLLLIFLLMLILFCRWRRCCLTARRRNDIYFAENGGHVRTVLLQQKQRLLGESNDRVKIIPSGSEFYTLTTTASPAHAVVHPSNFTLRSVRSGNSGYSSTRQGAGSRTALITECSSSGSSNGKTTLGECSSSQASDENYATLYDYVGDASERYGQIRMIALPQAFTPAYFNKNGGRIELKESGLSLMVPENAIPNEQTIYIAISDDITDRPKLPEGDTVVSATVMTGLCDGNEEETVLHRPIVVSFKHCANIFPKDNWVFMLYGKRNFEGIWEMIAKIGEENINTPVYCQLELNRCHVMTEQFGKLILVGRPKKVNALATKRVRIAAFGSSSSAASDAFIRVYCVPETGVALRRVLEKEENDGALLAQTENFLLREVGPLCLCLEGTSIEPYSSPSPQYHEIPETHRLWCLQNVVHCNLKLPVSEDLTDMSRGRIVVYQKGNADARQILHFDVHKPMVSDELHEECPASVEFLLDSSVRWRLADLLDTPTDPEKDWRGLAKKLNLHRYIQYFATRPGLSPTSLLLDMWEAIEAGSQRAVFDLLQTLRIMGRPDAVTVLDQYLPQCNFAVSP